MRFLRPLAGACAVIVACAAVVAQPPAGGAAQPPAAAVNYYPLKKGNKWVFKTGENTIEMVAQDGGKIDTVVNGKTVASENIEVKADGIYRTKVNNVAVDPPVKFMALPADKDASWEVNSKLNAQAIKGKFTQKAAVEKAKVAAGEFDCIVVDGPDFEIAGAKCGIKYWFAKDRGYVKLTYNIAGNEALLELKEFVEAK